MMDFILQRLNDNKKSTIGALFKKIVYGTEEKLVLQAFTLEDERRDIKVGGETRIPAGFYELGLMEAETPLTLKYRAKYPWFKFHIEITKVPNFKGVYIHIGNTDLDTDGCVLLGDSVDNNTTTEGEIKSSTIAFKRFYEAVYEHLSEKGKAFIEIRDEKYLLGK